MKRPGSDPNKGTFLDPGTNTFNSSVFSFLFLVVNPIKSDIGIYIPNFVQNGFTP